MARAYETEFAALDLETTGLDPDLNRIVEVAAIIFRGDTVLGRHETLVDPGVPIHPRLTAIHGITDRMVKGAPTPQEAIADLVEFIRNRPLVIHNAPFDLGFIESVRRKAGEPSLSNDAFDTCRIAPLVFPGLASYSLGNLSRALSVTMSREHRAADDSLAAMGIFLKCVGKIDPGKRIGYVSLKEGYSLGTLLALERNGEDLIWPEGFDILREASEKSRKVCIVYCGGSGTITRRVIAPTRLVKLGGRVMLEAWCSLRHDDRTFRFDRILEIHPVKRSQ